MKLHITKIHANAAIAGAAKAAQSEDFTKLFADVKTEPTEKLTGNGKTMKLVSEPAPKKKLQAISDASPTQTHEQAHVDPPAILHAQVQHVLTQQAQVPHAQVKHVQTETRIAAADQPATSMLSQILTVIAQQAQQAPPTVTNGLATAIPKIEAAQAQPVTTEPKAAPAKAEKAASEATDTDPLIEKLVAVKPELAQAAPAEPPLTPLEQAVADLLSQKDDKETSSEKSDPPTTVQIANAPTITHFADGPQVEQAAPVARVHEPQQELVSQNHAHIVLDDANGRIVMTVAVRGENVSVSVRSSDEGTAAALARNAGTLEDQMRTRGLALADFSAQRDLAREQSSEKPKYERPDTVKTNDGQRFSLEENS
ncbi:MAG: flagellar hook-length control protein FliK [Kofleriaceae bacterium]